MDGASALELVDVMGGLGAYVGIDEVSVNIGDRIPPVESARMVWIVIVFP